MVNCKLYFNLAQIDLFHVPEDLLDIQGELFDKLLKLVLFDNLNKDKWDKYLYGKFMLCLKKTLMCYVYQFGKPGNLLLTQKEYLNELLLKIVQVYYQNPILFEELDDFILYDLIVQKIKADERYHRSLLILLRSSKISKGWGNLISIQFTCRISLEPISNQESNTLSRLSGLVATMFRIKCYSDFNNFSISSSCQIK